MARWLAWMLAALALACAPRSEDAPLADCDVDAVVPLLVTARDESARLVGRAGETWVFEVTTYPLAVADIVDDGFWPLPIATRIDAVDGCGAEPRTVADGFVGVLAPPRAEFPWLARLQGDGITSGLYRIDPIGGAPPERIASDPKGGSLWVEDGVLAIDGAVEDPSTLVLIEFLPDGRLQKTALREGVAKLGLGLDGSLVYTRFAFVSTEYELFVRDIVTGDERLVREDATSVVSFDPESRALWIFGSGEYPATVIETDGTRELELLIGEDSSALMLSPHYVGMMSYAGDTIVESQIVWMPELREFRAPGRWMPSGQSPDGAIQLLEGPDAMYRLDGDSDDPVRLRAGAGHGTIFDDRIWLTEELSPAAQRLVRMELDGSGAQDLFGHEVAAMQQLDGDRWIYAIDIDARGLGELETVDLATGERDSLLDSITASIRASGPSQLVDDDPNDALVFRITPDEPDGNGIWLVHADRL